MIAAPPTVGASKNFGPVTEGYTEYSYPATSPLWVSHIQKLAMLKPEAARGASDKFNISVNLEYSLIAKKPGHAGLHRS